MARESSAEMLAAAAINTQACEQQSRCDVAHQGVDCLDGWCLSHFAVNFAAAGADVKLLQRRQAIVSMTASALQSSQEICSTVICGMSASA